MKRCLASLGATIAVVLAIGAGSALAEDLPTVTTTTPESGLTQSQSSSQTEQATNDIDQNATSSAVSAPGVQSNTNTPVYTGGSEGGGNVTQSNDSTANSGAVNKNDSVQGIDQDESSKQTQSGEQEGGCCADHNTPAATFVPGDQSQSSLDQTQRSRQYEKARNDIDQNAGSSATSAPGVQSNVNAPVRVGSDGSNGDVNQSNSSTANSFAGNKNNSWQGIDQDESSRQSQRAEQEPSSCCDGGGGGDPQSQRSYQKEKAKNDIDQNAGSAATSAPGVQTNVNAPVTVASNDCHTACVGGSGGNVDQSNSSTANSGAGNKNNSVQGIAQDESSYQRQWAEQEGSGCCGSPGELYQKQKNRQEERAKNDIDQNAGSAATSAPGVQANVNAPVRVMSDGYEGDVNQSNSSTANSFAGNKNNSWQGIDQSERSKQKQGAEQEGFGCCEGRSTDGFTQSQRSYQKEKAKNDIDQNAGSAATSAPGVQSNTNAPVYVAEKDACGVCGGGSSGDVNQSNSSTANSFAKNKNDSWQGIDQDESSYQRQFGEQEGSSCCDTVFKPEFIGSEDGGLTQRQKSKQKEEAKNDIDQNAGSAATSAPGVQSNVNAPVGGYGSSGDVNQSNSSTANSGAFNKNNSVQWIDQDERSKQSQWAEQELSGCCDGGNVDPSQSQRSYQKEKAKNDIDQDANSTATSIPGVQSNVNAPVSVVEKCEPTEPKDPNQSNSSTANSFAGNRNNAVQGIDQDERSYQRQGAEQELSGCCGGSSGDLSQRQRSYQKEKAKNDIDQNATSTATSAPGEQTNENAPVSVGGYGSSDEVNQSNSSTANSGAFNKNRSVQWIDQDESSKQTQWAEQEAARCCNPCDPCAKPETFSRRR